MTPLIFVVFGAREQEVEMRRKTNNRTGFIAEIYGGSNFQFVNDMAKIKHLRNSLLGLLILSGILSACDPCNNCGPAYTEPKVGLSFINASGVAFANDSLWTVDTLIYVSDSLDIVLDAIADGDMTLEDEKQALENYIDQLTDIRSLTDNLGDSLGSIRSEILDIISIYEDGEILMERLLFVNSGLDSVFTDSTNFYEAPLDHMSSPTELQFQIDGITYDLLLTYNLTTEADVDRQLLRVASGITVDTHSFDSVRTECETEECFPEETTISCYF